MKFGYRAQYVDFVEKWQSRKLVLFGAGGHAAHIISTYFPLEKIAFICDNNQSKWGANALLGIPICNPAKLAEAPDDYVILVCVTDHYSHYSVCRQLERMNVRNYYSHSVLSLRSTAETYDSPWVNDFTPFSPFRLINEHKSDTDRVRSWMSDEKSVLVYNTWIENMKYGFKNYSDISDSLYDEYFNDGLFEYCDNEVLVFIDVGSYDGTDCIQFYEMLGDRCKKVYFFEPDDNSYVRSCSNISRHIPPDKYHGCKVGLSDKNSTAHFSFTGGEGSRLTATRNEEERVEFGVSIARFDDIIPADETITFVKLDVEGEELNVLRGMEKSILAYKPKLAVSLYHKTEDLWTIPQFIKELVPEYRLFARHHFWNLFAKVLYVTI
jgi:FkbM family methyltransferase